ncbi:hypothetical protein P153DRAFT_367072 [Dothidotthia symphoricarpi CBS 119687]|uniref:Protein transport protein sec16 n=1 Tax=Dothidotthia symphoricarpi CBS 119687 TaxID=1392245 RepID=A0A6A6AC48_9PLEO|nr:uncharacterized protein P153DRAFT_367072 [Dothidotthia symphoricarpi CBS 119687]KAF2128715.1 hypothetical protein P153DRAFT_367072 [Dothidotthia symphoricarpi CBS 119687]
MDHQHPPGPTSALDHAPPSAAPPSWNPAFRAEKATTNAAPVEAHMVPTPLPSSPDSSDAQESDDEADADSSDGQDAAPEERLADNYEHQGETTALEDAMAESERVPLVADAAPTDDWDAPPDAFSLGQQPAETPLETPHAEAMGTTVGDSIIGNTTVGGNAGDDIDWGAAAAEDDFFGAAASQTIQPADAAVQSPGAHVMEDSQTKPEWGLDLDLDLDDEFLPDTDHAPLFDLDDDEGFLEDEPAVPAEQPAHLAPSTSSTASRYAPQTATAPAVMAPVSQYAPQALQATSGATPVHDRLGQPVPAQQLPARPTLGNPTQSFVEKSRGGYASPYDLPDDIVTTRRRPAPRPSMPNLQANPPPPPRSSSVVSSTGPPRPLLPSAKPAAGSPPPPSSHPMQPPTPGLTPLAPPKPAPPVRSSSSDFFAELPVTTRPKLSTRYTAQPNLPSHPPLHHTPPPVHQAPPPVNHAPPPVPLKERAPSWSSLRNEILPDADNVSHPLQPPEQLPMFPSQPSVPTLVRANTLPIPQPAPPPSSRYSPAPPALAPVANARYSPAPPSAQAANSRYSPAPGAQGSAHARYVSEPHTAPPRPASQPYAPRTSSPLAFHSVPQHKDHHALSSQSSHQQPSGHHVSQSADGGPHGSFRSPLSEVRETDEPESILSSRPPTSGGPETPPSHSTASSAMGSPRKRTNYTPQYQPSSALAAPRSQSPTTSMKQPPRSLPGLDQPGSGYGYVPQPLAYDAQLIASTTVNFIPHRRQVSLEYDCILPTDETVADPLQRWKGYPVFVWGLGGAIVTSFPKQIPRYGGGTSAPMVKCSPGEIKIQNVKDLFPLSENVVKFPGPLKSKGKKKDVSAWLSSRIDAMENELKSPGLEHSMEEEDLKRLEDKSLLWKIMQVLVDNDGQLEGPAAVTAVKKILSPEEADSSDADASFSTPADIVGRSRTNTLTLQAEPLDPRAIEDIQKMLTKGDREKAVWHAVDQRLWGHAMLLSSTLNKDIWKQVVQEFVRKEVKKVGRNSQALAVLYEVFAGNHEDCIDELVPASARAGFQMVSTDGAGAAQNTQQGLNKWRETVALVLNNRSEGDASALLSLGKLLEQYGRVEAAHLCFIFARSVVHISGVDDAQSHIVLVGANHHQNPLELGVDLDAVLLTEVYEFALSLSAHGSSPAIPHLQVYKLAHAHQLAEYGYRAEAQAYCDAIAAALKSTIRVSPYYNASFIASLDELSKRLSQSPKDGSSSWISKPSMDKVSSSLLSKFNSFIAGDDDDSAANKSAGAEVGPFAKIPGNSPSITPSQSSADLYGSFGYGAPTGPPIAPGNSKYAPSNNVYTPRTSSDQQRSRYEPGGRPSMESVDNSRALSDTYVPSTPGPYTPSLMSPPLLSPQSARTQAKTQSYSPLRAEHNAPVPSYGSPYMPSPPVESASAPPFGVYQPLQSSLDNVQPSREEGQSFGSYEPPTSSFDSPSYQPYNPDDDNQEEEQPRRKQFMDEDDDDDLATRASALKISSTTSKSDADRKSDEAFRKAAEEDAKRDKDAGAGAGKKGWFGGWFKKDPNAAPGPIKAKLGDENSFYYDPDLKKWINKKGGAADTGKPSATPPPPRSGPPGAARSASGMGPPGARTLAPSAMPPRSTSMPPPMGGPPSRASTPGIPSDTEGPRPPTLMPPMLSGGPPSRPGTGMSNASSIDDLLGAPQPRKGPGAKKKKGGRYVEIL